MLRARNAFAIAAAQGCSVEEATPRNIAALEVAAVWAEVSAIFGIVAEQRATAPASSEVEP